VLLQPISSTRPPHAPSTKGQGPTTPVHNPSPGACCYETSSRVHFRSPARHYSQPVTFRMDRRVLGHIPGLRTPPSQEPGNARRRGSQANGALARSHDRHSGLLSRGLTQNVRPVSHLKATVRDPSKVGPRRQAPIQALSPRNNSASAGNPTGNITHVDHTPAAGLEHFSRPRGVTQRDRGLQSVCKYGLDAAVPARC
jgi:hypothetical protein